MLVNQASCVISSNGRGNSWRCQRWDFWCQTIRSSGTTIDAAAFARMWSPFSEWASAVLKSIVRHTECWTTKITDHWCLSVASCWDTLFAANDPSHTKHFCTVDVQRWVIIWYHWQPQLTALLGVIRMWPRLMIISSPFWLESASTMFTRKFR